MRVVTPELLGDRPGRRVELLSDHDAVHVTRSRFGPGQEGADLHVHHHHTDFFYVLEGELTVRLGLEDQQVVVPAGSLARVPPDVVHGFRNAGDAELGYLNFHAPGCGFAGYMRGIRDGRKVVYDQHAPPADGGRPLREAVVSSADLLAETEALRVERIRATTLAGAGYVLEGEAAGAWVEIPPGVEYRVDGVFLSVTVPQA